jgi:hypothetical protein
MNSASVCKVPPNRIYFTLYYYLIASYMNNCNNWISNGGADTFSSPVVDEGDKAEKSRPLGALCWLFTS